MTEPIPRKVCPVCRKSFIPGKVNQVVCSRSGKCYYRYKYLQRNGRLSTLNVTPVGARLWHEHANKFITKHPTARRDFHELETVLS